MIAGASVQRHTGGAVHQGAAEHGAESRFAQAELARAAIGAGSAIGHPAQGHIVAGLAGGDIGADGNDLSCAFMSQNLRNGSGGIFQRVQVAVTDGRGKDFDQHFMGFRFSQFHFTNFNRFSDLSHDGSFHLHGKPPYNKDAG